MATDRDHATHDNLLVEKPTSNVGCSVGINVRTPLFVSRVHTTTQTTEQGQVKQTAHIVRHIMVELDWATAQPSIVMLGKRHRDDGIRDNIKATRARSSCT